MSHSARGTQTHDLKTQAGLGGHTVFVYSLCLPMQLGTDSHQEIACSWRVIPILIQTSKARAKVANEYKIIIK